MVMADKISLRSFCPGLADKKFLCLASSYSKSESDSNLRWLTGNKDSESRSDCMGVTDEIHCKYHTKISLLQEINLLTQTQSSIIKLSVGENIFTVQ